LSNFLAVSDSGMEVIGIAETFIISLFWCVQNGDFRPSSCLWWQKKFIVLVSGREF